VTPSRLLEAAERLEARRITGMYGNNDPQDWSIELKEGVDPLCIEAAALLREAHAVLKEIASSYRDDGTEQDGNCYIEEKTGARLRSLLGSDG
jgi:hypothetical protein